MEPLRQWICDVCGDIIERPEDGYLIWKKDENRKLEDMLIIHKNGISEKRDNKSYPLSSSLKEFLGDEGLVEFLSLIDPGPLHVFEYKERIANMRKFLEVFRRMQIPYYEEARIYWSKAKADGYFADANEVSIYLPRNLKKLIETYRQN